LFSLFFYEEKEGEDEGEKNDPHIEQILGSNCYKLHQSTNIFFHHQFNLVRNQQTFSIKILTIFDFSITLKEEQGVECYVLHLATFNKRGNLHTMFPFKCRF
jgi:hypothetical protein